MTSLWPYYLEVAQDKEGKVAYFIIERVSGDVIAVSYNQELGLAITEHLNLKQRAAFFTNPVSAPIGIPDAVNKTHSEVWDNEEDRMDNGGTKKPPRPDDDDDPD